MLTESASNVCPGSFYTARIAACPVSHGRLWSPLDLVIVFVRKCRFQGHLVICSLVQKTWKITRGNCEGLLGYKINEVFREGYSGPSASYNVAEDSQTFPELFLACSFHQLVGCSSADSVVSILTNSQTQTPAEFLPPNHTRLFRSLLPPQLSTRLKLGPEAIGQSLSMPSVKIGQPLTTSGTF